MFYHEHIPTFINNTKAVTFQARTNKFVFMCLLITQGCLHETQEGVF